MTDSDLLMLENITYFDDAQMICAGVTKTVEQCDTMQEFLSQFDEKALSCLDNGENKSNHEWAARIRYMQSNSEISSLVIKEYNDAAKCFVFEQPGNSGRAIVAFKGTTGTEEWIDDVQGLNLADTPSQLLAKEYIESLGYDSITVTGHSKGGNKAMYLAITCSNVDRCVSFDGQGFSKEFIDKYAVEIQARASRINNYSLSNDYVHELMYPVPGSNQIYMVPGNRVGDILGPHYPIGPFTVIQKDGKWYIDDTDGLIQITENECQGTVLLHEFTTFLMNNMSKEELQSIVDFLGPLIAELRNPNETGFDVAEYVWNNHSVVAKLIAYLIKYMEVNDIGLEELLQIIESLGLTREKLYELIGEMFNISASGAKRIIDLGYKYGVKWIIGQLTDGSKDRIIEKAISSVDGSGRGVTIWREIEEEYTEIEVTSGTEDYVAVIRDYSSNIYDTIMEAIDTFERSSFPDVSGWNSYAGNSWFSRLLLDIGIKCINGYTKSLSEINQECKRRVEETFDTVRNVDNTSSLKLDEVVADVSFLASRICAE